MNQRKSIRDPTIYHLNKADVKQLLYKIKSNHEDTRILKIKDHLLSDIHICVLDAILKDLYHNKICQALYLQNLCMNDELMNILIDLLKNKMIWCLNIGENYNISALKWQQFCDSLLDTNITHLYVSEHIISIDLKNQMREYIRRNRKKHTLHCSLDNIKIIERCTHMWWNPINTIKHQFQRNLTIQAASNKRIKLNPSILTPNHTAYWAEGIGKGGDKPWKFSCACGERCSSYENYRYHPIGRMYECTICSIWSHVDCVLGNLPDDDIEELEYVLCHSCKSKQRRIKLLEFKQLGIQVNENNNDIQFTYLSNYISNQLINIISNESTTYSTGDLTSELTLLSSNNQSNDQIVNHIDSLYRSNDSITSNSDCYWSSEFETDRQLDSSRVNGIEIKIVNTFDSKIDSNIDGELDNKIDCQLSCKVTSGDDKLASKLDNKIYSQLDFKISKQPDNEISSQLDRKIDDRLDGMLDNQLDDEIGNTIDSEIQDSQLDRYLQITVDSKLFSEVDG